VVEQSSASSAGHVSLSVQKTTAGSLVLSASALRGARSIVEGA